MARSGRYKSEVKRARNALVARDSKSSIVDARIDCRQRGVSLDTIWIGK